MPAVYQFFDVSVKIGGTTQGLVQSVTLKGDAGLDLLLGPTSKSGIPYSKHIDATVDIEYFHNGYFVNPTSCALYNGFGTIVIGGAGITLNNCILIGTKSSADANQGFGGKKILSYRVLDISSGGGTSRPTTETGKTGAERACFQPLVPNQVAYESSCTINREFINQPGRGKSKWLAIQYPIVTTASVTVALGDGAYSIYSVSVGTCPAELSGSGGGIDGVLAGISTDGGTTGGGIMTVSYNYQSTNDYGLTRILEIP